MPLRIRISWPISLFSIAVIVCIALDVLTFWSHQKMQTARTQSLQIVAQKYLVLRAVRDLAAGESYKINADLDALASAAIQDPPHQRDLERLTLTIGHQIESGRISESVRWMSDKLDQELNRELFSLNLESRELKFAVLMATSMLGNVSLIFISCLLLAMEIGKRRKSQKSLFDISKSMNLKLQNLEWLPQNQPELDHPFKDLSQL